MIDGGCFDNVVKWEIVVEIIVLDFCGIGFVRVECWIEFCEYDGYWNIVIRFVVCVGVISDVDFVKIVFVIVYFVFGDV